MASFLAWLVAAYLVFTLCATFPYWYEKGSDESNAIPSLPYTLPQFIRLWLQGSYDNFLLLLTYPLAPFARLFEKTSTPAEDDLPPVLLVHGLYRDPAIWLYMRRRLRKAGFGKIRTASYASRKTNIAGAMQSLEEAARDMERHYPGQKFLLVGHSLGGLLARNWLADAENQKRVVGALTLGTPHGGSKMAALAIGELGRSLHPSNPFFADLAKRESEATIPCVALACQADALVLPLRNLVPPTKGWAMRLTPYSSHMGLATSRAVARMVVWELYRMATHEKKQAEPAAKSPESAPAPAKKTAPALADEQKKLLPSPEKKKLAAGKEPKMLPEGKTAKKSKNAAAEKPAKRPAAKKKTAPKKKPAGPKGEIKK